MTNSWPPETLAAIDEADDLKISPLRSDGVTHGTPTWIWSVTVDGDLYVRGYNGKGSRWFQAALAHPDGRIHAAGQVFEVTFEPAPPELTERIDNAYLAKYAASRYLPPMISPTARAAGVRVVPRWP